MPMMMFWCLQGYTVRKRMEHVLKATMYDGRKISVVDPRTYSQRFQESMRDLFVCKEE